MKELQDILSTIRAEPGAEWGLATLVRVEGSSYRRPGARMLMDANGPRLGALSGGCLEGDVFARWREDPATPRLLTYDLRGDLDLIWGTGSGCEGLAEILVESLDPAAPWVAFVRDCLAARQQGWLWAALKAPELGSRRWGRDAEAPGGGFLERILPPIQLWVFGASDDAQPLVRMGRELGWRVGVADHRSAFANLARFPDADAVRAGQPRALIPGLGLDARSAVVLITHNYAKDVEALRLLLPSGASYLGLMGHRDRCRRILAEASEGLQLPASRREEVFAPVGLDLGAQSPETIALAILAEIQANFGAREGGSLRWREGAIHEVQA